MGWLPCSGKSNTKANKSKKKKRTEEMALDRLKPTSGKAFFF